MSILYKPVKIESAAQAEALPIGTVTLPPVRHSGRAVATVKCDDGFWRETGEAQPFTDPEMLDEIALVPIEAEEEWGEQAIAEGEFISVARYVTPWEETR